MVYFDELEAWLRQSAEWKAEMQSVGKVGSGYSVGGGGGSRSFSKGSALEREALFHAEISARVNLIDSVMPTLPEPLQEFIQIAYLEDTGDEMMGNTVQHTCQLLRITRTDYMQMRERALLPFIAELYYRRVDPGKSFSYCGEAAGQGRRGFFR